MIRAGRECCSVREHQAICRFVSLPVRKHPRLHIAAVISATDSTNNVVANFDITKRFGLSVDHQYLSVSQTAVNTTVTATPKGID